MRATIAFLPIAISFATVANAEETTTLSEPVEKCIRTYAPMVEQAVASLTEATDFIVTDICAVPITEETARRQKEAMRQAAEAQKRRCAQNKAAGIPTKVGTGEDSYDPCAMADFMGDDAAGTSWTIFAGTQKPADATMYASRLLLDLRRTRANTQPK